MEDQTCISCKRKTTNTAGTVVFNCPSCKSKITRCGNCRSIAARYTCTCGFTGPN
ncbi:MAG TPA: RNA-binding protein [Candidatus Nanoarchaeia archaeon]|nr:RNA-binding protein [Candidatus Nanoarchaeia archaeon]